LQCLRRPTPCPVPAASPPRQPCQCLPFSVTPPRPLTSILFPYTTLFRSPLPMFGLLTHGVYPFHKICFHILSSLWHFYRVDSISLRAFRNKHQPSTYEKLP